MEEKTQRKCIIRDKEAWREGYGHASYYEGGAMYGSNLYEAKIFDYNTMSNYLKDGIEHEIIFLDSKEGLELCVKEVEKIQGQIDLWEGRINSMKKGLDNLFNANPDMINEYITARNKRHYKISNEEDRMILRSIVNSAFK